MLRVAILIAGSGLSLVGCAHTPKLADARSPEQYRAALRQLIPPGTKADDALAILKAQGFDAGLSLNQPFWKIEMTDEPDPEEVGDSIFGERVRPCRLLVPFLGEKRWRVVLILKNGAVDRYRTYLSWSAW